MDFGAYLGIALVLVVWSTVQSKDIPNGVIHMECRDRYLMVIVDLSFTGEQPRFEVVDGTGVYAITKQYAAQCGYSVSPSPLAGYEEHRASYFSCHTENKDDQVFTFNFNLIVTHEGNEVTYAFNKTCSPSLPWSPREVTCEVNYMEVSVRSELTCPSGTKKDDWNALKPAHGSNTSDWQVMFQRNGEASPSMTLPKARKQGYMFDLTAGRLVFRAPYGQPDSFSTEVNGVPVETVHATLFSRQSWVVLMVDLVAACSMHGGSYDDDGGYMMWVTPEDLYPSLDGPQLNLGLNGDLVEQPVAEQRGYMVEKHNSTIQISIPFNTEGGYRKSVVADGLYKFYVFHLYLEQILVDEDHAVTRLLVQRSLTTPLLPCAISTENLTVLDEQAFTVYLGDVPEDVQLAAVHLNGHECTFPFTNASKHSITEVVHPNNTHGYTLKVMFDDPVVVQEFSKEDAVLHYGLHINYTFLVLPENEPHHHLVYVEAVIPDVSPPVFDAVCSESGISFKLDHRPFDYLWLISIGSDPLTSELAAQHGYIMTNDSQSLLLEVPLFSHGYEYKDVTLKGFSGTFKILMRDPVTSEVQSSTIKTCQFSPAEFIMCSTDGKMTVVVDLSLVVPSGGSPARSNLVDKYCRPKETDGNWALFSVPLNGCGATVKLNKETVTYRNEIFYSHKKNLKNKMALNDSALDRVIIQCTYPVAALHRLFSSYKFESDTAGVGTISHSIPLTAALPSPTIKPTTVSTPAKRPVSYKPAIRPPFRFIALKYRDLLSSGKKGLRGSILDKENAALI